jgi:hypothetical protein
MHSCVPNPFPESEKSTLQLTALKALSQSPPYFLFSSSSYFYFVDNDVIYEGTFFLLLTDAHIADDIIIEN